MCTLCVVLRSNSCPCATQHRGSGSGSAGKGVDGQRVARRRVHFGFTPDGLARMVFLLLS
jgi:hypothetical protein